MKISDSLLLGLANELKMLWLAPLLIFISVGGSHGVYDYECFTEKKHQCDDSLLPKKVPDTSEELLRACRILEQYGNCIADVKESCHDDEDIVEGIRQAVGFLRGACQEDNPTFEVVSSNLECLGEVAEKIITEPCVGEFSEGTLQAAGDYLMPLAQNEEKDKMMCFEELFYVGCQAMKFARHCGDRVGGAMEQVLWYLQNARLNHICTEEVLVEIYPLFEGLVEIVGEEMQGWDKKRK